MANITALAYQIDFVVSGRSKNQAISDVKATGELINQASSKAFKQGAKQRQQEHDRAVSSLRKSSEGAMADLASARDRAGKEAEQSFKRISGGIPTPEEHFGTADPSKDQLKEYSATFAKELASMEELWKAL